MNLQAVPASKPDESEESPLVKAKQKGLETPEQEDIVQGDEITAAESDQHTPKNVSMIYFVRYNQTYH